MLPSTMWIPHAKYSKDSVNWWKSDDDHFLYHNGEQVVPGGTYAAGFTEHEHCFKRSEIDIVNDTFQIKMKKGSTDGICITSLTVDGEPVLTGGNRGLNMFWIDDNENCHDDFMATTEVTVRNGVVISDYCKNA